MTRTSSLFALIALSLAACDGGSVDKDHTEDISESAANPDPSDSDPASSARTAHIEGQAAAGAESGSIEIRAALTGEVVGEGDIDSAGHYVASVEAEVESLVVTAYDESGERMGEVLVSASGGADSTVSAAPMTSETSVEAGVFVQIVADYHAAELEDEAEAPEDEEMSEGEEMVSMAELRARIDASVAAAVEGSSDAEGELEALATAIRVAAEARAQALAEFDWDAGDEHAEADAHAMAEIEAALAAGLSADEADDRFAAALDAAVAAEGYSEMARSEAEATASLGLRATLNAFASAESASWEMSDAAAVHAAHLESLRLDAYLEAAIDGSTHGDAIRESYGSAMLDLQTALSGSIGRDDAGRAWSEFEAEVVGSIDTSGEEEESAESGVLTHLVESLGLETTLDVMVVIESSVDAVADLTAEAHAMSEESPEAIEPEAMAAALVDARLAFQTSVFAAAESEAAELAASLVVGASGGFTSDGHVR
jgi:hypothetical protein